MWLNASPNGLPWPLQNSATYALYVAKVEPGLEGGVITFGDSDAFGLESK